MWGDANARWEIGRVTAVDLRVTICPNYGERVDIISPVGAAMQENWADPRPNC
jgi:hypothetical protein